jgi:signal peptidase I
VGLVAVFAIARLALSRPVFTAGDAQSSAVVTLRGYLDWLIVVALAVLLLLVFVIRIFYISSISMIPTLQVGDVFLTDSLDYRLHAPAAGDVAVFVPPVRSVNADFIKRVIGVPGDTIRIYGGIVYRNGKPLSEPYENEPASYDLDIRNYGIYVNGVPLDRGQADIPPRAMWQAPNRIPAGFYLMLGDNRNYSDDSHIWGFAPRASFAGRALLVLWPLNHLSFVRS